MSHQSFVDLFVGFIFIPLVLALPLLAIPGLTGEQTNWLVLLLYAAYPIAVFTLKAKMPVRVLKYDEQSVVVGISNDEFAREFRVLNG